MTTRRIRVANRAAGGLWWRIPLALALWAPIAAVLTSGGIVLATVRSWSRDLPAIPDLATWRATAPQTSRIVAADGTMMAELPFRDGRDVGHRELLAGRALPHHLIAALLAAEDVHFLHHGGVDATAVVRAAWANWRAGRVVEGASTITQQIARNLLPAEIGRERTLRRKVREALVARAIERRWSKSDILAVYADLVYLGAHAHGVVAGARAYFDREPAALTVAQAALLAGVIQAPSRLDPYVAPEAARRRRDEVLARMYRAGLLDDAERTAAVAEPLVLSPPHRAYGSIAPWYTEQVRRQMAATLDVDPCPAGDPCPSPLRADRDEAENAGGGPGDRGPRGIDRGGLLIETAALPALAITAEMAAQRHGDRIGRGGPAPQVAALLWDHRTGYVEALVGGRSWGASQFDRIVQACRQPGSAWKPIVYAAALQRDAITPGTPLRDAPIAEYDELRDVHWKPRSGRSFRGVVLAQDALALSLNAPAIDVLDRASGAAVIGLARRLGVSSELADVRPLALGASCVRPIELARAYAVLARRGRDVAPRFVVRVRRGDEVLFDEAAVEDPWLAPSRRLDRLAAVAGDAPAALIDERTAFLVTDMLAAVVDHGTATAARQVGRPAAGKTGTTNDNTDAWFVGFTARELGVVWVGHDDPSRRLGPRDDGARAALPLWVELMELAEGGRPPQSAVGPPPAGVERARIDRETGLRAAPGAGGAVELWFKTGTVPAETAGRSSPFDDFGRLTGEF